MILAATDLTGLLVPLSASGLLTVLVTALLNRRRDKATTDGVIVTTTAELIAAQKTVNESTKAAYEERIQVVLAEIHELRSVVERQAAALEKQETELVALRAENREKTASLREANGRIGHLERLDAEKDQRIRAMTAILEKNGLTPPR